MRRHHLFNRRRSVPTRLVAACLGLGALACAGAARAQVTDVNPPLPNVLLLLDTSGSMETMMDNCNPDTGLYPDGSGGGNCNGTKPVCDGKTATTPTRWGAEIEALTGTFANNVYSCFNMPRALGSAFDAEYSLQYSGSTVHPYDVNYYLNFHRPAQPLTATTACVYGFTQGASGWNADNTAQHQLSPSASPPPADFLAANIQGYVYNISTMTPVLTAGAMTPCPGGFGQNSDGLISLAENAVRFGMMTFDSDVLPNVGVTSISDSPTTFDLTFNDVANTSATNTVTTGMWSYFNGWESTSPASCVVGGAPPCSSVGRPAGCATDPSGGTIPFEVGARNPAAPPWEGRLIRFPSTYASPATNNTQIMNAIRVMRPYGANPIAGMMDDAKYFMWNDPEGPGRADSLGACRQEYIILLSHAAPNEDLQTYCQGSANGYSGICPYDYPEYIAAGLAAGSYTQGSGVTTALSASASGPKVKTFVVGFSANQGLPGTGGDSGTASASCSDILIGTPPNTTLDSTKCGTPMTNGVDAGASGNPVYAACCALARIAIAGGTGQPYFADNQTDLNQAFRAILAQIVANATTRATPVLLPQAASSASGTGSSALFLSSFVPSKVAPWSGDVQRQRYACSTGANGTWGPQQQPITQAIGDDFQFNLQSNQAQSRNVIVVEPYPPPPAASPPRTASGNIRPYVNGPGAPSATGAAFDGYTMYDGVEYGYTYTPNGGTTIAATLTTQLTSDVLFPSACTYKQPGAATAFTNDQCENIAFDYAMGVQGPPTGWNSGLSTFPTRYYDPTQKVISNPFGAVYHSTPAIATPPSALIRDDSYQTYINNYTTSYTTWASKSEPRHTVLYVATIDGLLHAFGVDYTASDPYTFIGTSHQASAGTQNGTMNELWSFIPPAVMPQLINGLGGSQNVLLDGSPVVKDVVYQRTKVGTGEDWHTALVAGFGQAQGGYYAMDVTDPDFTQRGSSGTAFNPLHGTSNTNTPPYMSTTTSKPQGPHFLWQLTDSSLFAPNGGTPAITTVYVKDPDASNALTEIGVAILPGGASTPTSTTVGCPRLPSAGKTLNASPIATNGYQLGPLVRQWGPSGCPTAAAPARGRSLTIVRLDTGEVLRTFAATMDLPSNHVLYNADGGTSGTNSKGFAYHGRVTTAEFDSPISGTPVPYPADVGALAKKVFVGDQDGTIWRLDVSDTNPVNWFIEPLFDAFNTTVAATTSLTPNQWATQRSPIVSAPAVSVGRDGNLVLNFGTGDLNLLGQSATQNYVYSVSEEPDATSHRLLANVNWYDALPTLGEMVAGPSVVFDGGFYFASYSPGIGTGTCPSPTPYLWGMDFVTGADTTGRRATTTPPSSNGGVGKYLDVNNNIVQKLAQPGTAVIPGVTITSNSACAQTNATLDPATGGYTVSVSNVSPAQYSVSGLVGAPPSTSTSGAPAVGQVSQAITSVHTATFVDSWASIVE